MSHLDADGTKHLHNPDQPWSAFWMVLAGTLGGTLLIWGIITVIGVAFSTLLRWFS